MCTTCIFILFVEGSHTQKVKPNEITKKAKEEEEKNK